MPLRTTPLEPAFCSNPARAERRGACGKADADGRACQLDGSLDQARDQEHGHQGGRADH